MDLHTPYLGLSLKNPIVAAASTKTGTVESATRLASAGVGAIVLRSIFEEQIRDNVAGMYDALAYDLHPEALDYLRADLPMELGPEGYLKTLRAIRAAVDIPVIASINCTHPDTWMSFARKLEAVGADALELNIYDVPDNPAIEAPAVEARHAELVSRIVNQVRIPVSVKIAPFYTTLLQFAKRIEAAGANGLVLFNRFFQPDIDIRALKLKNVINFSTRADIRLPLRWTALLRNCIRGSLALTGGVHDAEGVIKALLAGADAVQICSVLYSGADPGEILSDMLTGLNHWMRANRFDSVSTFRGLLRETDLSAHAGFERFQYVRTLAEQR